MWPIDGIANAIGQAIWNIFLSNITNFISNAINSSLPYIAGIVSLIILFILILKLF